MLKFSIRSLFFFCFIKIIVVEINIYFYRIFLVYYWALIFNVCFCFLSFFVTDAIAASVLMIVGFIVSCCCWCKKKKRLQDRPIHIGNLPTSYQVSEESIEIYKRD